MDVVLYIHIEITNWGYFHFATNNGISTKLMNIGPTIINYGGETIFPENMARERRDRATKFPFVLSLGVPQIQRIL